MRIGFLLFLSFISANLLKSQCTELVVTGFNADNPDEVLLKATADLAGNSVYYITDNEWDGTSFNSGETTVMFTVPAEGIAANSTILFNSSGASCGTTGGTSVPTLSTSGEEIYVTRVNPSGAVADDDICFSVSMNGNGNVSSRGVDLGNNDNGQLTDHASGDPENAGDWTTSNSRVSLPAANCQLLPVILSKFKIQNSNYTNIISWQTAEEINNSHFELEHSIDGRLFSQIAVIEGKGNTRTNTNYNYTHNNVKSGSHYYRIKQVDFDGNYEYFGPIKTFVEGDGVLVYPTTTSGTLYIKGDYNENETYQVFSISGQMIEIGSLSSELDFSSLERGTYILKYLNTSQLITKI